MRFYFEKASTKTHVTLVETRCVPPLSVCFLLTLVEVIHTFKHPFSRSFSTSTSCFRSVSHIDSMQVLAASLWEQRSPTFFFCRCLVKLLQVPFVMPFLVVSFSADKLKCIARHPSDHQQQGEHQRWEPPLTSDCPPRDLISHRWEGNTRTPPSLQRCSATAQSMHCRPLVRMMHARATPDWIGVWGEGRVRLGKPEATVVNVARGGVGHVC